MDARFSEDGLVVVLSYAKAPSLDEWIATILELHDDPRCKPGTALIVDRTRVGAPTKAFVHGAAEYLASHPETFQGCRLALVVPDLVSYGMGRMGQMLVERHNIHFEIFTDIAAAEAWARTKAGSHTSRG